MQKKMIADESKIKKTHRNPNDPNRFITKNYTITQIIDTLRNMNVCAIDEYGYIPAYTRTELTDELHEIFGFNTDTQILRKAKKRSIIKQSKER